MEDFIKYVISRLIDNANDSLSEAKENPTEEFYQGKRLAYYEMLDTIKNELDVREFDLKEFGLDVDLDKLYL